MTQQTLFMNDLKEELVLIYIKLLVSCLNQRKGGRFLVTTTQDRTILLINSFLTTPNTGKILKIYQQPTGTADAVSMQHDVDYAVCAGKKNEKGCKHDADKKMVKALDAIPKNKRQWGHAAARNAIASKHKMGLGVGEMVNQEIGAKIPGFSQAQDIYKLLPGVDKQLLDKYWSGDIAKGAFNTKDWSVQQKVLD